MSAFVCSPEHFQAIASFATYQRGGSWRVDPRYIKGLDAIADQYVNDAALRGMDNLTKHELAGIYANVLYSENIRSCSARYPNESLDSMPGLIKKPMHIEPTAKHDQYLSAVDILKMLDCLEYQSCETDDYHETVAYRLLNNIRRAAIRSLVGYDKAQWDFTGVKRTA